MKKLFLLSVAATLISSLSFATIRRVNYPGTYLTGVDYADISQADLDANDGDTLQIYGSISGNITKRLILIGFGYNFDANTGLQAIGGNSPSSVNIGICEGSSGSVINGIDGNFNIYPYSPVSGASDGSGVSNITFQRCQGNFYFYNYSDYGPISNINIFSCAAHNITRNYDAPITNLKVYNSILYSVTLSGPGTSAAFINCVGASVNYASTQLYLSDAACLVKNCILAYSQIESNTNTVYENNFFAEDQPIAPVPGSNNRWSQDWATIFTRNGSTDETVAYIQSGTFDEDYYVLKAGSPAINGGFNAANQATNCGIYGGEAAYAYKISGVPAIPAIYQLTAPTLNASTNPYNVTISVRSNN